MFILICTANYVLTLLNHMGGRSLIFSLRLDASRRP